MTEAYRDLLLHKIDMYVNYEASHARNQALGNSELAKEAGDKAIQFKREVRQLLNDITEN